MYKSLLHTPGPPGAVFISPEGTHMGTHRRLDYCAASPLLAPKMNLQVFHYTESEKFAFQSNRCRFWKNAQSRASQSEN